MRCGLRFRLVGCFSSHLKLFICVGDQGEPEWECLDGGHADSWDDLFEVVSSCVCLPGEFRPLVSWAVVIFVRYYIGDPRNGAFVQQSRSE